MQRKIDVVAKHGDESFACGFAQIAAFGSAAPGGLPLPAAIL